MNLKGKVAVVTGASRGIGAGIARRLANDGATVAIVYQSRRDAADTMVRDIRSRDGQAAAFQAEVSNEASVQAMINEVVAAFGKVDILINAAGIYAEVPVGQISRKMFEDQFFVNTWSVVVTTQAALPHFPSSGGAIVNVSTSLVELPGYGSAIYSASKAAVDTITRGFAMELGPRGIRINGVAPHITRTDMTADIPAEALEQEIALTPLGRLAEPEDIADAVAFLASDDARWITGRTILLDGGRM